MSPGGSGGGSGGSQNLANLIIQFQLQGQQALQQALAAIQQQTQQLTGAINNLGLMLQTTMMQTQAQIANVASRISQSTNTMRNGFNSLQMPLSAIVLAINKMNLDLQKSLQDAQKETKNTTESVGKLQAAFEKLTHAINLGLGAAIATIGNFVRQGLAAGAMGQIMQFQMERLALTISGLFRPEIQKVIDLIEKLTGWLNSLSNQQRAQIAHWIEAGAAALAVSVILPRIVTGIQAVIGAVAALGAAIAGTEAITGIGAILPIIGLIAQGLTALLVGTEAGRAALSEMWDAVKELGSAFVELFQAMDLGDVIDSFVEGFRVAVHMVAQMVHWITELIHKLNELTSSGFGQVLKSIALALAGPLALLGDLNKQFGFLPREHKEEGSRAMDQRRAGGFESLDSTYRRIAQASRLVGGAGGKSAEQRTADGIEQANRHLARIDQHTGNTRPLLAR